MLQHFKQLSLIFGTVLMFPHFCFAQPLAVTVGVTELEALSLGMTQKYIEKIFGIGFKQSNTRNVGGLFLKNPSDQVNLINLTVDSSTLKLVSVDVSLKTISLLEDFRKIFHLNSFQSVQAYSDLHMQSLFMSHGHTAEITCANSEQIFYFQSFNNQEKSNFKGAFGVIDVDWFRAQVKSSSHIEYEKMLCLKK